MTEELGRQSIPEFGSQPEHLEAFVQTIQALQDAQLSPPDTFGQVFDIQTQGATIGLVEDLATLQLAGLSLTAPQQPGTAHSGPQESVETSKAETPQQVRVQLENGQAFCDFLERAAEQSGRPAGFNEAARTATDHLLQGLTKHFASGDTGDDPHVANTIGFSGPIADKLEILTPDDDTHRKLVDQFRACQQHAAMGTIREWVGADELHLFDTAETQAQPERSGPSVWHQNMTPLETAKQWDKVLGIIQALEKNPDAEVFLRAVLRAAYANLWNANRDWVTRRVEPETRIDRQHDSAFAKLFEGLRTILAEPTPETPDN